MPCSAMLPIGNFIELSSSGGWGRETETEGYTQTAIIRGADFPSIQNGSYSGIPIRFEKKAKVEAVQLHAGDIVLENSGGTAARPTGRTVLVTQGMIDHFDCPVIPASFCRLLRFSSSVDSAFAYYWLQNMYRSGRTWAYQNRSTGLSNFQYKVFSKTEMFPVISIEKQRSISSILLSLDKKRIINNRLNGYLEELGDALFRDICLGNAGTNAVLSDVANITMGQSPAGSSYNEEGKGEVFYQGRGEFGWRFPRRRLYTTEPKRMAALNDVLMSVRAPVGDLNVAYENCCIGRGLAAIHSEYPSFCLYLIRSLRKDIDAYNGEGTVFGSINGKALKTLPIFKPDESDIRRFEHEVSPIDAAIRINESESRTLTKLRDALLPKLMSGEIDVSEV